MKTAVTNAMRNGMRRHLFIALILVVLVAAILLCIPNKPAPLTEPETASGSALREELQPRPTGVPTTPGPAAAGSLPQVTMTAVEYEIDYAAWSRELSDPSFEFRGQGTSGRVTDKQGNTIVDSSEDFGIFGISLSPDKKKILVKGGDGKNLIFEPSTNKRIVPPFKPPGSNLFPFMWHWIGPDLLFGVSGVEKACDELGHENCCGENNVAQTKFYTFDLIEARLSEVVMPSAVTQPVVNVVDVMSDGHVHLMHEEPHEGVEQDLGWFKIDNVK